MPWGWAGLVGLIAAAGPAAGPAPVRVAIIAGVVEDERGSQEITNVAVFERVARGIGFVVGMEVVARGEVIASEMDGDLRRCGSDVGCLASRLRAAEIALAVSVVANFAVEPPVAVVRFIDCASSKVVAQSIAELEGDAPGDALAAIDRAVTAILEEAGHPQSGRVIVEVTPDEAPAVIVLSEGTADREIRNAYLVPAPREKRTVRISASAPGYLPSEVEVEVTRGVETQATILLQAEPSILGSSWFWLGASALIVAGVSTALLVSTLESTPYRICARGPDPCD